MTCTLTVSKSYVSENGNEITVDSSTEAVFTLTDTSTGDTETLTIYGADTGTIELPYNGTHTLSETTVPTGYTAPVDMTIEVVNGIIYVDDNQIDTAYVVNTDYNHEFNGMSYAIANLNSSYKYALLSSTSAYSGGGLAGGAVTKIGENGYYTYVSGQRLSIAKQLISDGKSPGKEFRFDGWKATDINGNECIFDAEATVESINSDGSINIYDSSGTLRTLSSCTTLTAQWTEISDIVMFFVNYSGTVLDIEGDVSGRNQKEFTGIISIGHVYFGTTRVGNDSTLAAEADTTIRNDFAYTADYDNEIVQIVIEYVTIDGQGIYNLAEGINDSILDEYLLTYIRESGIIIKISTADGTNPAIENENATTDNYTVRWYVLKEQVDGWHIDGVMVAKTAEITITKTFSGEITYAQLQEIYEASASDNNGTNYNRLPYYIEREDGSGNTYKLYLQDAATRSQSGFTSTGGIGTTIFYVVGGVLVVGAVILLITKKRMKSDDKE